MFLKLLILQLGKQKQIKELNNIQMYSQKFYWRGGYAWQTSKRNLKIFLKLQIANAGFMVKKSKKTDNMVKFQQLKLICIYDLFKSHV